MQNNSISSHLKTRAIIIRSSDQSFLDVLNIIKTEPDCFLVFSKTSNLKLKIVEEGW